MNNEAIKLGGMAVIKDLGSEEEFDLVKNFLLIDPLKITHLIQYFKNELINANDAVKGRVEKKIAQLEALIDMQVDLTCRIYSLEDVKVDIKEKTKPVKEQDNKTKPEKTEDKTSKTEDKSADTGSGKTEKGNQSDVATKVEAAVESKVDPSKANLKLVAKDGQDVKDNKDPLREKYGDLIKNITFDELKVKVSALFTDGNAPEAIELATYILSNGHYKGKKAKPQKQESIDQFIKSCKPAEEAKDDDLSKVYAAYLNENKMSMGGLKAEVKFLLHEGHLDKAIGVATYILTNGEYLTDDGAEPSKYTEAQVEEFLKAVREDLSANPMNLNPEGSTNINPDAAAEADKQTEKAKQYDLTSQSFYDEIRKQALKGATADELKKYIFDTIKTKNVESFELFYKVEKTTDEFEKFFETDLKAYVMNCIQTYEDAKKAKEEVEYYKSLDINKEIKDLIDEEVKDPEFHSLMGAVKGLRDLFIRREENVGLKECRELVYNVAREAYPVSFNSMLDKLNDTTTERGKDVHGNIPKIKNSGEEKKPFNEAYPELYEEVKDLTHLDDVVRIAKEWEAKQSFTVVSEMIMHLISSGKIKDADGNVCAWDEAQINLWITTMFPKVTPEKEKESEINPTQPAEETAGNVNSTTEGGDNVQTQTEKKAEMSPSEKAASESTDTPTDVAATQKESQDTTQPAQEKVEDGSGSASVAENPSVNIPEEDVPYAVLYSPKKDDFMNGIASLIESGITDKKDKVDIIHDISDKIHAISRKDEVKNCFVRNYKSQNLKDLYKFIIGVAIKNGHTDWKGACK